MEFRQLGKTELKLPVLSFGTATFGGNNAFFKAWGDTDAKGASRLVDICIDAEMNFFDTANVYSGGASEEILGQALEGRRNRVLISTKATLPTGQTPADFGSTRKHLLKECESSLKRLKTDYIDLFYMHAFDSFTPIEETLKTLDELIQSGKIRHIGCSNFSAWHLMKSLSISKSNGWRSYVAHQVYYSLVGRELEWELMPLAADQGISNIIWSPLAGGALTGKIRRNQMAPKDSRLGQIQFVKYDDEVLFQVVETLAAIATEREKTISQIALNWLLKRPTVTNIVVGARNETQLLENLGSLGWKLSESEMARLDSASERSLPYPYWHQRGFPQLAKNINQL